MCECSGYRFVTFQFSFVGSMNKRYLEELLEKDRKIISMSVAEDGYIADENIIKKMLRLNELTGVDNSVADVHRLYESKGYANDEIRECVEELAEAFKEQEIKEQENSVTLSYDGSHGYIYANKMMMEELVYNLTDNAIRYNNKNGSVDVSVKAEDGKVILRVKDTGIGIPKEHQERIFERFYRVDKSRSKSTGGTGLGLAIVKHIVARNNAQLDMDSEPGKGTDIKVTFDAYREDEQ